MAKRSRQKHIKMKRTLYILGYRDYLDGRSRDHRLFAVLKRSEKKAYLKGQRAALRLFMKMRKKAGHAAF
jgi:hypothetical protein